MMIRLCNLCGIERIKKGRQIYCGSYKRKTGCSYIMFLKKHRDNLARKYKEAIKNNPDYNKKRYLYYRKYYLKNAKTQYEKKKSKTFELTL